MTWSAQNKRNLHTYFEHDIGLHLYTEKNYRHLTQDKDHAILVICTEHGFMYKAICRVYHFIH